MRVLETSGTRDRSARSVQSDELDVGILDEEEDKKRSEHVTFRCPPEVFERLEKAAADTGWSRSKLLVRLVRHGLDMVEAELNAQKKPRK